MIEFTGLDLEMVFKNKHREVVDIVDKMFLFIFKGIKATHRKEVCGFLLTLRVD